MAYLRPYEPRDAAAFRHLVSRYFREDLRIPLTGKQVRTLAFEIAAERRWGVSLALLFCGEQAVGFIDYQLDFPESSWCFHPGWGCLREVYLVPERRGRGLGRRLYEYAADDLAARGGQMLYLTADDAIAFWEHLGFRKSGRINERNELEELEKAL